MTRPAETLADLTPKTRAIILYFCAQDAAMQRAMLDFMVLARSRAIDIPNAAIGAWVERRAARYRALDFKMPIGILKTQGAAKVIPFPRARRWRSCASAARDPDREGE